MLKVALNAARCDHLQDAHRLAGVEWRLHDLENARPRMWRFLSGTLGARLENDTVEEIPAPPADGQAASTIGFTSPIQRSRVSSS